MEAESIPALQQTTRQVVEWDAKQNSGEDLVTPFSAADYTVYGRCKQSDGECSFLLSSTGRVNTLWEDKKSVML